MCGSPCNEKDCIHTLESQRWNFDRFISTFLTLLHAIITFRKWSHSVESSIYVTLRTTRCNIWTKLRTVHWHSFVRYEALAVSTRPPDGVVSALWASILSALAGLCKEFYWLSPGGAKWLKHSLGQRESPCQVWSWSAQPIGRPSATDR